MTNFKAFIIDDDKEMRISLVHLLTNANWTVEESATALDVEAKIENFRADVVLSDVRMPGRTGTDFLKSFATPDRPPVILMSAHGDIPMAVNAIQTGAYGFLEKPFDPIRLLQIMRHAAQQYNLVKGSERLKARLSDLSGLDRILLGNSDLIKNVKETILDLSEIDSTVLIHGATGTGKELVAKAIHYNSKRAKHPFIAVNLTSLSDSLLESELFGFVKGAFTGATQDRRGKFEEAGQGTIFLDEIAEINETVQVKLLRVLQELEISKVGSNKIVSLRCRIICATNKDLAEEVRKGNFRQDLFYRLMGLPINLPRLIERDNDILVLSKHFSADFAKKNNTKLYSLSDRAITKLNNYHYPGNVRELKSIIDLACVLSSGEMIDQDDIVFNDLSDDFSAFEFKNQTLKQHNKSLIEGMLNKHNNNVRLVAEKLGIGKSTIYRIIK